MDGISPDLHTNGKWRQMSWQLKLKLSLNYIMFVLKSYRAYQLKADPAISA